jgi:long-chain acyl-CoA synthetase
MSESVAAQKPWLSLYPPSLPPTLEARHPDMLSVWRAAVKDAADREAIRYFDASLSYREIDMLSDGFAVWLAQQGVGKGDRVSVILQNVPHVVIASVAAWKLGAIPVPGNPMYTPSEFGRLFADFEPAVVVCHQEQLAQIAQALDLAGGKKVPIVSVRSRDFQTVNDPRLLPPGDDAPAANDLREICARLSGRRPPLITLTGDDVVLILYTSGTTGVPKGAVLSHANLAFIVEVTAVWTETKAHGRIFGLAPLFHITGFACHMALAMARGCSCALHYRFHPDAVLEAIRSYKPTFTTGAVTAFNALMNAEGACPADFACFEHVCTGGAPVAPALRDQIRERLGVALLPSYGMTESCAPTHIAPFGIEVPVDPATGALAVGLPISSTEARVVGPDGETLPPGTPGEIWMRGPQVMLGYWNKPEETARTLHDGWLRSGDVGVMDETGWFYVVDRQKDMIVAAGFKVWPREVEDVLIAHEHVREAAVVGAPDAYRGETVWAYISLRPGVGAFQEAGLLAHCRAQLATYKVPRRIIVLDELPKTATGKIQRAVLRARSA